jgi:hypothetical protein
MKLLFEQEFLQRHGVIPLFLLQPGCIYIPEGKNTACLFGKYRLIPILMALWSKLKDSSFILERLLEKDFWRRGPSTAARIKTGAQ